MKQTGNGKKSETTMGIKSPSKTPTYKIRMRAKHPNTNMRHTDQPDYSPLLPVLLNGQPKKSTNWWNITLFACGSISIMSAVVVAILILGGIFR